MAGARENLLEVKGQVSGNDADVEQVLHRLKLTLLEVAEDVQVLQRDNEERSECVSVHLSESVIEPVDQYCVVPPLP